MQQNFLDPLKMLMDRDIKEIMVGMHWSCYVYDLPFMIFIFFLFPIPRFPSSDIARSSKVAVWIMITSAASNRAVVCWPKKRYCTFPLHFSFPLTSHLLTLAQSLTLALFHTHTHTHTFSLSLSCTAFVLSHPPDFVSCSGKITDADLRAAEAKVEESKGLCDSAMTNFLESDVR